jgi:hypothetical protein
MISMPCQNPKELAPQGFSGILRLIAFIPIAHGKLT